jgi:hypothetical protein
MKKHKIYESINKISDYLNSNHCRKNAATTLSTTTIAIMTLDP